MFDMFGFCPKSKLYRELERRLKEDRENVDEWYKTLSAEQQMKLMMEAVRQDADETMQAFMADVREGIESVMTFKGFSDS